ncbi:hypothetical protein MBLNU13_g10574t1 [Cladosporium sp. NU13]
MAPTPAETEIDDLTKYPAPEQAHRQRRKRSLEEDVTLDTTNCSLSGRERDAHMPRDTMLQSTSPTASARRTRTGRVSKAAKGMPVHHCDCGKTYTRAEHLRRHQQNHEPGAFPCDVLGCDRTFSREDLLIRHKAKHNELPRTSESSVSKITHTSSRIDDTVPSLPYPSTGTSQEAGPNEGLNSHRSSLSSGVTVRKEQTPATGLNPQSFPADAGTPLFAQGAQSGWYTNLQALQHSASGFQAAELMLEQCELSPLALDTSQMWTTGATSLGASRSPISPDSLAPTSSWRGPSPGYVQLRTPASEYSVSNSYSDTDLSRNSSFGQLPGSGTALLPAYRDFLEQDELVTPTSAPQNFGARQLHHHVDNEQRYLEAYWRLVHPIWPIIHRPTFDVSYTSPLLRSAMLTMGACMTGDQVDAANACILHKRCLKVIKKRTVNNSHSYRICDMQAILMVELFCTYKSRRPPSQPSKNFQDSYCALTRSYDMDTSGAYFPSFDASDFPQDLSTITLESESRQRLLAAYYILDQEQTTLFGRRGTDVPDFLPASLGLPQPLHIWDSDLALHNDLYNQADGWRYDRLGNLGQDAASTSAGGHFDIFVASLALAYSSDTKRVDAAAPHNIPSDLDLYTPPSNSPHIDLARQTFALCNSVPIRALLAVAGESWVMAEKLNLYAEYKAYQDTFKLWTGTLARDAFVHALKIIQLHRVHPKTTCLYHEWSLHLASLVVWACTHARRLPNKPLRLSIPLSTDIEAAVPIHKLDKAMTNLMQAGADGQLMWDDAKLVVTWAKTRIEKTGSVRFCGVVSGAVDVLKALMARGDEDGWF